IAYSLGTRPARAAECYTAASGVGRSPGALTLAAEVLRQIIGAGVGRDVALVPRYVVTGEERPHRRLPLRIAKKSRVAGEARVINGELAFMGARKVRCWRAPRPVAIAVGPAGGKVVEQRLRVDGIGSRVVMIRDES